MTSTWELNADLQVEAGNGEVSEARTTSSRFGNTMRRRTLQWRRKARALLLGGRDARNLQNVTTLLGISAHCMLFWVVKAAHAFFKRRVRELGE